MSAPGSSHEIQSEEDDPRTIFYDPNDPFWQDTEDDNDDIDYVPAPGDSEEDDGLNFHGALTRLFLLRSPGKLAY
jgi:WD repeat-containing protein 23